MIELDSERLAVRILELAASDVHNEKLPLDERLRAATWLLQDSDALSIWSLNAGLTPSNVCGHARRMIRNLPRRQRQKLDAALRSN